MQAQSSPWPEIPLSPMIKSGVPDSAHNGWQASHTGRSSSLGGDGSSSEHSEAAQAANPRTPVRSLHIHLSAVEKQFCSTVLSGLTTCYALYDKNMPYAEGAAELRTS